MADQPEWMIVFYIDEQGHSPVAAFLESLDLKTQARFDWSIEQLRVRNVQAGEPLVKHIDGKLWELRRASSGNILSGAVLFPHWPPDRVSAWVPEEESEDTPTGDRDGAAAAGGFSPAGGRR
jgi:hypothetical protein